MVVFALQISSDVTESLMYYPQSWNPVRMITSSLAHADWFHLIGNMIFYLAFAPALEILLGSKIRYIWIMLFIVFVVGISDSIAALVGLSPDLPSLGFSGVVMGMIGLSAYLMPQAKIRVFWWWGFFGKTFFVRAWILAAYYIGFDTWTMITASDYGGIGVVAHVAGGVAGYLYGYLWLEERREEVQEDLTHEIKVMNVEQQSGKSLADAARFKKEIDHKIAVKKEFQEHDRFMGRVYKMVETGRDSDAVYRLMSQYDLTTPTHELEDVFERIQEWGASRTLLCIGRLIIYKLDTEMRYGTAIFYIEKCQQVSPQFVLPDVSRTLYYAQMAFDTGKFDVTKNLVMNSRKRYGNLVNCDQCNHLLQKVG